MNAPAKSKINYAAIALTLVTIIVSNIGMSAENQALFLELAGYLAGPLIIIFRTWFTDKSR